MLSLMHGAARVYVCSCRVTGVDVFGFPFKTDGCLMRLHRAKKMMGGEDLYCKMLDIFMINVI